MFGKSVGGGCAYFACEETKSEHKIIIKLGVIGWIFIDFLEKIVYTMRIYVCDRGFLCIC